MKQKGRENIMKTGRDQSSLSRRSDKSQYTFDAQSLASLSDDDGDNESFRSPLHSDDPKTPPRRPPLPPSPPPSLPPPPPVAVREAEGEGGGSRAAARREVVMKRVELGFRVCEVMFCLISLSVMVSDTTKGWSGDSFYRYKEYRYCVAVNIIGAVYSGLQACDLCYHLIAGKYLIFRHHLRYHFNFATDQILADLLISASSAAATRVGDWVSNWGKDEFTEMATASIGMSFLAFAAFSLSSLISGYKVFL